MQSSWTGMSVQPLEIVIAIQAVQALAAIVLALLLRYFFNTFGQGFLRHWALSASALALYLGSSAAASAVSETGTSHGAASLGLTILSLAAVYPHVAWLMIGTWEALRQREIRRNREWTLVGATALFGVVTAVIAPSGAGGAGLRELFQVDLHYALAGAAFLTAGILLWRALRAPGLIGARVAAIGFCLLGLQMFHVLAIDLWSRAGHSPPFYSSYVGLLDFLFQSIIAVGIVVWLLELQRRRMVQAHEQLAHVQRHDPTTGLPNRQMLVERIEELKQRAASTRIAVISLGMNRYALVNRALGWRQAEQVMHRVGMRIHQAISQRCALGRISERDFVVLRPTLDSPEEIRNWTEKVLAAIVRPLHADDRELFLTFCAGISLYPDDDTNAESLIQHSQHALVQSTQIGRNVTLFHQLHPEQADQGEAALRIEAELRRALAAGQFELHYQPIVRTAGREVVGFEALLRWRHPERGLLQPESFLDEAASIGILGQLESFVLEKALGQLATWQARGRTNLSMSVNFSAMFFQQEQLAAHVVEQCRNAGVEPGRLIVEITENTAIQDLDSASSSIAQLQQAGIGVALDDFGTGYSSLGSLLKLEVDRIKLDRVFLDTIETDARQRELVAAMIGLGQNLGTQVVAEGVEQPGQLEFLEARGCDLFQGYLWQAPAVADECKF